MDFHKLGYRAIVDDKSRDSKAFNDALAEADSSSEPWSNVPAVYQGAIDAAVLENDEQKTRSIILGIMAYRNLHYRGQGTTAYIAYGIDEALRRYNFLVATLFIEYIHDDDLDKIHNALFDIVVAAFNAGKAKTAPGVTQGLRLIFQTLINKSNKSDRTKGEREKLKTKKLLDLTNNVIRYIGIAHNQRIDTTALDAILYLLLQHVILPPPPTEGDDFYAVAREKWEAIRLEKIRGLKQGTPPSFDSLIIKNVMTFGLQRFCAKCHGEVL
jgi:hypothetical protein